MANSITPTTLNPTPALPTNTSAAPAQSTAVPRQEVAASGKATPPTQEAGRGEARKSAASAQEVAQATRDISDYIQTVNRSLQISVDQELGSTIITVTDKATDEVVRQIPGEEAVELARFLARQQSELGGAGLPSRGVLMDQES